MAIAEGNLDPCTMEAFNHFPLPGDHIHLSFTSSSNRLLGQEKTTESTREGCFTIVSCNKTTRKRIRGIMPPSASSNCLGEGKVKTMTQEVLHEREALALEKLAFSFRNETPSNGNKQVSSGFALEVPNNNPFKKRKQNDVQPNQMVTIDEQASEVTEIGNSEISCVTRDSQESVDSKLVNFTCVKSTRKTEKILKHVESKRSSILSFFSRV